MANWNNNTITLGPLLTGSGQSVTIGAASQSYNIFEDPVPNHVKKYEVFEIEQDILLLSVVWQRMREERAAGSRLSVPVSTVIDKVLFDNVTSADISRTAEIREYYSKKLTWWVLNDIRLSNFREDMKELIGSNGKVFQERMKPLAYRLPEFYDYDIQFDKMFMEHNTKVKQYSLHNVVTKRLNLEKMFTRKRRSFNIKEYWFVDEHDNLNTIVVNKDNALLSLLDLHVQKPFDINGIFTKKVRDNREYCVIEKYSFL